MVCNPKTEELRATIAHVRRIEADKAAAAAEIRWRECFFQGVWLGAALMLLGIMVMAMVL